MEQNRIKLSGVRIKPILLDRLRVLHLKEGKRLDRSSQSMTFSRYVERILDDFAFERHRVAVLKDKEWDIDEFD